MNASHWLLLGITVGPSLALVVIVWIFARLIFRICKLNSRIIDSLNDTVIGCPGEVGGKGQS